jgi:tetratricopeptide (TPR) repeat protein
VAKALSVQERILALDPGDIQEKFVKWMLAHRLLIGSVGTIILLLLGGSLYWRYQRTTTLERLHAGIVAFQAGDAQKAVTALQQLRWSSLTNNARVLGHFYLGEAHQALGNKDDTQREYEAALSQAKRERSETYLEQLVLLKLAAVLAKKDMNAASRQRYEQAAKIEGPFSTDALASAARLAEKMNDTTAVKTYYEKLSNVNSTYPLAEWFQGKAGK